MSDKAPDSFHRFQNTMRALLAVPKKEIDEQAAKTVGYKKGPGVAARQGQLL